MEERRYSCRHGDTPVCMEILLYAGRYSCRQGDTHVGMEIIM